MTTRSVPSAVLSAQQFIADSVLLLNELPGTRRNALVAAPRSFDPDPAALRTFMSAVSSVPWLAQTGLDSLIDAAAQGHPAVPHRDAGQASAGHSGETPVASGPAVLTAARGRAVENTLSTVAGVAQVRADGADFRRVLTEAEQQLTSARWRGRIAQWNLVHAHVSKEAQTTAHAVSVSPRNVNFLADKGRLQITVMNALNVAVHDVTLRLTPDNPRLRVDEQPAVIHIGARSRTTVTARVTSPSQQGLVPITTTLTGPDGTVLGRGAVLKVQLSPTGNWVYWALARSRADPHPWCRQERARRPTGGGAGCRPSRAQGDLQPMTTEGPTPRASQGADQSAGTTPDLASPWGPTSPPRMGAWWKGRRQRRPHRTRPLWRRL